MEERCCMRNCLALFLWLACYHSFGQCPFPVTLKHTGTNCLGSDTLFVSTNNKKLYKISWYKGATLDTTVLATHGWAQNGITVAGGARNTVNAAGLAVPVAIFIDDKGYLYVADQVNNRIVKFPPGSTSATKGVVVAGGNGAGLAANQLYYPFSVFVDRAGYLYVADAHNQRIQKFPPNSTSQTNGVKL